MFFTPKSTVIVYQWVSSLVQWYKNDGLLVLKIARFFKIYDEIVCNWNTKISTNSRRTAPLTDSVVPNPIFLSKLASPYKINGVGSKVSCFANMCPGDSTLHPLSLYCHWFEINYYSKIVRVSWNVRVNNLLIWKMFYITEK